MSVLLVAGFVVFVAGLVTVAFGDAEQDADHLHRQLRGHILQARGLDPAVGTQQEWRWMAGVGDRDAVALVAGGRRPAGDVALEADLQRRPLGVAQSSVQRRS